MKASIMENTLVGIIQRPRVQKIRNLWRNHFVNLNCNESETLLDIETIIEDHEVDARQK